MNQKQLSIPVEVRAEEIARKQTLGSAMELCAELGGFALDKELQQELEVDKAQFSRWLAGTEGIVWPKFERLMEVCGNDAPILWMLHQRGYDLESLRKRESETEKRLRIMEEECNRQRHENALLRDIISGRRSA